MPGERGPRNVPMIPLADLVALSGSHSNHSSRKSAALIVISLRARGNSQGQACRSVWPQLRHREELPGA